MTSENSDGSTSTSNLNAESSESAVEINVKTLDSQVYSFRVDKHMPVPSLKEKVANATGVPVEQQRLIFRGKVLKDDQLLSEYHVEDGDTLHLVVRPPVQSQAPIGTNSADTSGNSDNGGNDASAGAPRTRVGVSRSVVLGSFNVGDNGGEGGGLDLSRIIGAVLNSIGVGNQNPIGGVNNPSSTIPSNGSNQVPQGIQTSGTHGNIGGRSQPGNQMPPGQASFSHPVQPLHQSLQFPLTGAAVVIPSPQMPIPDALHTLSEFMNRMELALSATGYWPSPSSNNVGDSQRADLLSNSRGLATPEALSVVLRRAQHLMSGHAVAALSHIAGRLEGQGGSTDPAVRNQIQTESVQVGLALQHLGSLLLELGRTTLTFRMGQSPAESLVNAGPAVYISPSGPNPLMVQPFPLQTSSLFGGSASSHVNSGLMGPIGPGDAPRNVNIHIHAGDSGSTRLGTLRNAIAAAVPSRSSVEAANSVFNAVDPHVRTQQNNRGHSTPAQSSGVVPSNMMQPSVGDSAPQSPSGSVSIPTLVAEINATIRNLVDTMRGENQIPSGPSEGSTRQDLSSDTSVFDSVRDHQQETLAVNGAAEKGGSSTNNDSSERAEQQQPERNQHGNEGEMGGSCSSEPSLTNSTRIASSPPSGETTFPCTSEDHSGVVDSKVSSSFDSVGNDKGVPIGLGLGGLQPKRRNKQVKSQGKNVGGTSCVQPVSENQQLIASGQQVLQSLASRGSNANTSDVNNPSGQPHPARGDNMLMGAPDSSGQLDAASMMSQVLNSPALNGLLGGVSEQAGIGSPDGLRNMLEQFTQSPSMRNALNQIVQQVDGREISNFPGMTRGQGGGIDLSRMLQQMMPIVSQALTGAPTTPESSSALESREQQQSIMRGQGGGIDLSRMVQQMMPLVSQALTGAPNTSEPCYGLESGEQQQFDTRGPVRVDKPNQNSQMQIDLQQVAQSIEQNDPPEDVFRTVVESVASLYSDEDSQDLVEELCRNEDLANEFMEMLQRNLHQR